MPPRSARHAAQQFWRSSALPFVDCRWASDSSACYAPHAHASLSLGAVDDGQSVFRRDGAVHTLSRGDVVLIPAGEVHSCNPEDEGRWSYQMLYLDTDWLCRVVGEMGAFDAVVVNRLPPEVAPLRLYQRLSRLNACLFGRLPDAEKEVQLLLFAGDVFAPARARRLPRTTRTTPQQGVRRVQELIAARYAESLSLDELARTAGMSRYHLVRAFHRALGMTPHAWQLDRRIQRARVLLEQGMPLAEVALQLGFADQSHFQRAFKQRVAATPGEYRRPVACA